MNDKKNPSLFARLFRCTRGGTAEKLVIIGLAVTAAAASGTRLIQSSVVGGQAAGDRSVTGAAGHAAGIQE